MVKKIKKEVADQEVMSETVTQAPKKKISVLRALFTGVLLVITTIVWYQVGVILFGFVTPSSDVPAKPVYSDETVVAEIDGQLIKLKDVRAFVKDIPQLAEVPFEMIYPQVLENMINMRILLRGAESSGVSKDKDVQKALKMAKEQILSQAYLVKQLEKGMTPEALKALYVEEMKGYQPQEEIHVRHILVDSKKDAENILIQLKAGANFVTLANEKSLDENSKGGDLGYLTENMVIPELGRVVFAMKKGQLSDPIKTPYGWHIVFIEDRRLSEPPVFEEMQEVLKQVYAERNMQNILQDEREKAKVIIHKSNLQ